MIGEHIPNRVAFDAYNRFRRYVDVKPEYYAFFRPEFLSDRKWRAVVVSEELSPAEASDLARMCDQFGYKYATVLDIDHFDSGLFFEMRLSDDKLCQLNSVFLTPSYLLVEKEERFMLVSDSDHYWSIAGPTLFLSKLFVKPLDQIDEDFRGASRSHQSSKIVREITAAAIKTIGKTMSAA